MLGRTKNTIERLRYLNEINLIPKQLLVSKNNEMLVESIVLDFLKNDEKYSYLTAEKNIKDNEMYPYESQIKMLTFLCPSNLNDAGDSWNDNIMKNCKVLSTYQMLARDHLEKVPTFIFYNLILLYYLNFKLLSISLISGEFN